MVKIATLEFLDSRKLISRTIWVTEKSYNFHTVNCYKIIQVLLKIEICGFFFMTLCLTCNSSPPYFLILLTWWNFLFINFEELSLPSFFNWLHPFSPHKKIWTFPYFSVSNVETKRFYSIVMGQTMFKLWCSNEYVWVCSMLKNDFRVCSMNNSVNPVKAF